MPTRRREIYDLWLITMLDSTLLCKKALSIEKRNGGSSSKWFEDCSHELSETKVESHYMWQT